MSRSNHSNKPFQPMFVFDHETNLWKNNPLYVLPAPPGRMSCEDITDDPFTCEYCGQTIGPKPVQWFDAAFFAALGLIAGFLLFHK